MVCSPYDPRFAPQSHRSDPETEIDRVARLVEAVNTNDRLAIQLILAPEEPAEPDEIAALEEGLHDPERGQLITFEQVKAELGIS